MDTEYNVVIESGDFIFHEEKFSFKFRDNKGQETRSNTTTNTSTLPNIKPNTFILPLHKTIKPKFEQRRSKRVRVEKDFGLDFYIFNIHM